MKFKSIANKFKVWTYPVINTASAMAIPTAKPDKWPTCKCFQFNYTEIINSSLMLLKVSWTLLGPCTSEASKILVLIVVQAEPTHSKGSKFLQIELGMSMMQLGTWL